MDDMLNFFSIFGSGGSHSSAESPSLQHLDITYLHDRIIAIGRPWENRTEKQARRNNICDLGRLFEERHENNFLVLNLSYADESCKFDYYKLGYQVLECDLERRCTLESMFKLCHVARYWLEMNEHNVLAVFCNTGIHATRLFVSTFLVFNGRFDTTHESLEYFYRKRDRRKVSSLNILAKAQPSLRHFLDKATYILSQDPENMIVPQSRSVSLYMVLIDHLPCTSADGVIEKNIFSIFGPSEEDINRSVQPLIRIYQCGLNRKKMVYCCSADPESSVHWCPAEGKLVLKCDLELCGDVEIECVFPNNTSKHLFRFCFHTGFLEKNGVYTIPAGQLDTNHRGHFDDKFKMDLVIQPAGDLKSNEGKAPPVQWYFNRAENKDLALDSLIHLHFVNPDPTLCEKMFKRGFREDVSQFALQRTNNSLFEAINLIKGDTLGPELKEEDDFGSPSPYRLRKGFIAARNVESSPLSTPGKSSRRRSSLGTHMETFVINCDVESGSKNGDDLSPFLKKNFGHGLSSPNELTPPKHSKKELPFINDEEMTRELESMLQRIAESRKKADPQTPIRSNEEEQQEEEENDIKSKRNEEEAYAKYRRMLKVGVQPHAIRLKMLAEGLNPSLVLGEEFEKEAAAQQQQEAPESFKTPVKTTKKEIDLDNLPEDYKPFLKMLKMGIPEGAVQTKMLIAGFDPTVIGLNPPGTPVQVGSTKSRINRKKLHWEALPENKVKREDTFWTVSKACVKFRSSTRKKGNRDPIIVKTNFNNSGEDGDGITVGSVSPCGLVSPSRLILDEDDPDMKELELLFVQKEDDKGKNASTVLKKNAANAKQKMSLLDGKRSQNVGIGLKKLKLDGTIICKALNEFDDSILTLERLHIIQTGKMLPTVEEEKKLSSFRGDASTLGEPERFLRQIAIDVKGAKTRLEAMVFRAEYHERVKELRDNLNLVKEACDAVRNSESLQRLFQVVLLIGNKLNAKGNGQIYGFTVASLLKLSQTKSFNRSTTILDFVASFAVKRIPESVDIREELSILETVKKLQYSALEADESSLHIGLQAIMRVIKLAEQSKQDQDQDQDEEETRGLTKLREFGRLIQDDIQALEMEMEMVRHGYVDLLEYFCEDLDLPMHDFFSTLDTFLIGFTGATREIKEKMKRKERAEKVQLRRQKSSQKIEDIKSNESSPLSKLKETSIAADKTSAKESIRSKKTPTKTKKWSQVITTTTNENQQNLQNELETQQNEETLVKPMSETPNLMRFLRESS